MVQTPRALHNDTSPTTTLVGDAESPSATQAGPSPTSAAIGIPAKTADNAWKVVGSPSRRGSLMSATLDPISPVAHMPDDLGPRTLSGEAQTWGSFGGIHWDGPSMFDDSNSGVLSVPMLPGVPLEPVYRQQRSLSFSMGQDPATFGYDDYDEVCKNQLETMAEEDEEDRAMEEELSRARLRERSKSSGAAFGLLSSSQSARLLRHSLRRNSEQHEDLRSPLYLGDSAYAGMSLGDKEHLERYHQQRQQQQSPHHHHHHHHHPPTDDPRPSPHSPTHARPPKYATPSKHKQPSQPQDPHGLHPSFPSESYRYPPPMGDYTFPDLNTYNNPLYQRRPSQLNMTPLQHLTDQLEATHLSSSTAYTPSRPLAYPFPDKMSTSARPPMYDPAGLPLQSDENEAAYKHMGKGVPISSLGSDTVLYAVEFKAGRSDYFYADHMSLALGDLVVVEGDRGKDLGKIAAKGLSPALIEERLGQKHEAALSAEGDDVTSSAPTPAAPAPRREAHVKRIFRLATPEEVKHLLSKEQDERRALVVCQQKTRMRKLPMEVVDAEYQWDGRKLTFYFIAERRIDFRELVRELFKLYKTRIWMCAVNST